MEKFKFDNIKEVILAIKSKNFDRNFASILGLSFAVDESTVGDYYFKFNDNKFNKYSFLFYFFDVGQIDFSDDEFKAKMENILSLRLEDLNPNEIKKILFEKQLRELRVKFDKNYISEEVYKNQVSKYID